MGDYVLKRLCYVLFTILLILFPAHGNAYNGTLEKLLESARYNEILDETIPSSLKQSGYYTIDGVLFYNFTLIRYPMNKKGKLYRIPEGITGVDQDAFDQSGACEMREIYIPESCVSFGYDDEYHFTWGHYTPFGFIAEYHVSKNNPAFSSLDGVLFDKNRKILLQYPIDNERVFYRIPDGVHRIEMFAFAGCNLSSIEFPASLRSIGCEAFYSNMFKLLHFNDGLQIIEDDAFNASNELESVTLPSTLRYIGNCAFTQCFKLSHITLPNGLLCIDSYAFYGAPIETLLLPQSLKFIGDSICGYSTPSNIDETPVYHVYQDSYAHQWAESQNGVLYYIENVSRE